jgi:hypothetical protein
MSRCQNARRFEFAVEEVTAETGTLADELTMAINSTIGIIRQ